MSIQVAPPYSKTPATELAEGVLIAISGSQQQEFISEIKALSEDVKFTINAVEAQRSRLLQEDAEVNQRRKLPPQAKEWRNVEEKYKKQILLIKDAAMKAKIDAITPFVKIWSYSAEEDPDTDVLIEFDAFSKKLAEIKAPIVNFKDIFRAIELVKRDADSKLAAVKGHDPEIKKLNEEIEELEKVMKKASDQIKEIVPGVFQRYGLNGRSHKLTLLLACGPCALVRSLKLYFSSKKDQKKSHGKKDDKKGEEEGGKEEKKDESEGTKTDRPRGIGQEDLDNLEKIEEEILGIHSLWIAADTIEDCERKLEEKRAKLAEVLYLQEQSRKNESRWNISISHVSELALRMDLIFPKLASIAKIAEAVKGDVDSYITLLKSPKREDKSERQQALAEIALSRGLYQLLDNALEDFVTQ